MYSKFILAIMIFATSFSLIGCDISKSGTENENRKISSHKDDSKKESLNKKDPLSGTVKLDKTYKIPENLWIEGLLIHNNNLYVSTGENGESGIGILHPQSGTYRILSTLDSKFYGEGITFTDSCLWQLTYKHGLALKRDIKSLKEIGYANYDGEGWGLTYDPKNKKIYMSNGTPYIYLRDPNSFSLIDKIHVTLANSEVKNINELEYANGHIYANVWLSDYILKISENGKVVKVFDLRPVLNQVKSSALYRNTEINEKYKHDNNNYLNGIAHISGNRFYITCKYFPFLMEVELND